jgi:single-stranded-DNA-specific exonuclease
MRTWIEPQELEIPAELKEAARDHHLVARRLLQCGFTTKGEALAFLDPFSSRPSPPAELPGLSKAAGRLEEAVRNGEVICVWGDFDVDGQTATTLLVSTLQQIGAKVFHHIPVRAEESHGVNLPNLERAIKKGANLVLTCDTGIAAHDAADYAKKAGVDFIVTDHHDLPESLPGAYAIVNPKLLPEGHPLYSLPGVGTAYKLAEELYHRQGSPRSSEKHLDLVALGIVADLAFLHGETRRLLQLGLDALRRTERLGLQIMLETAGVEQTFLTEEHIGFILGPRLNALGRLDNANAIVEFLTTKDIGRARFLASHLEALNARRKLLTDQVFQAARSQLETEPSLLDNYVILLSHPAWPAGVIGIVASRLVERYNRPVILLSSPQGEAARGSARSIPGININTAIARQADLLEGFGGHPMAAGLSIQADRIPEFRHRLSKTIAEMVDSTQIGNDLTIDAFITLPEINLDLAEDISRLAPFGPGNPSLTFACRDLVIKNRASLGRSGEHLAITVEDPEGHTHRLVWWQGAGWELPEGRFDLAFNLRATSYSGTREVQMEWVDARPGAAPVFGEPERPQVSVHDYRRRPQPVALLKKSIKEKEAVVWCEGEAGAKLAEAGIPSRDRRNLTPCRRLIIWTSPPGPDELKDALASSAPDEVVLFAIDPETAQPQNFITRLSGLLKYAVLEKGGQICLAELAAATAHREGSIHLGLSYLEENGHITTKEISPGCFTAAYGSSVPDHPKNSLGALKALLKETAAYRSYYARADYEQLLRGE